MMMLRSDIRETWWVTYIIARRDKGCVCIDKEKNCLGEQGKQGVAKLLKICQNDLQSTGSGGRKNNF
jgi:hypothetical protein